MDGMLSQEEINALLSGVDDTTADSAAADAIENLDEMEKDMMGEISNISMGTAATTMSSLVNQKVDITTPNVSIAYWDDLVGQYDRPCVFLQISYREGLSGNNVLILKENDVKIIADLMMGGDGTNISDPLGELHLSAISEAMNQMMGSASTSLSSMLNMKIDISPPTASLIDLNDTVDEGDITDFLKGGFVKISFKMTIGDLVDSEIMQLYPVDFCKNLCAKFMSSSETAAGDTSQESTKQEAPAPAPAPTPAPVAPAPAAMEQQPMQQMGMPMQPGMMGMPMQQMGMPMQPGMMGMPMQQMGYMPPMQEVNVQNAQFQAFSPDIVAANQRENINLIMDVPLEVTVELGRTTKSIQDILEFSPGTIIELDKIAGEPIDVLVNGKYVARGEVVVIEESFGVRVTEIIK
ncbi:MAG: flagellar motor switch phosphatase FliY [Lachnospiraceae bacterium]|nr:flagellar motor switch phosphatase FliY [Lachnospiraceae bacterium]